VVHTKAGPHILLTAPPAVIVTIVQVAVSRQPLDQCLSGLQIRHQCAATDCPLCLLLLYLVQKQQLPLVPVLKTCNFKIAFLHRLKLNCQANNVFMLVSCHSNSPCQTQYQDLQYESFYCHSEQHCNLVYLGSHKRYFLTSFSFMICTIASTIPYKLSVHSLQYESFYCHFGQHCNLVSLLCLLYITVTIVNSLLLLCLCPFVFFCTTSATTTVTPASARTKQPSGCVICTELYNWPQHLPSHDLRPFQRALACPAAAQPSSTHSTTTLLLLLYCSVPLLALSAAWLLFQCCCSIIPPSKTTIHPVFPVHHKYSEPSPYKTTDFVRTAQSAV
jgi:hypothetical protein